MHVISRSAAFSLLIFVCFGGIHTIKAAEPATQESIRAEIMELKRQKRMDFAAMLASAKSACLQSATAENPLFRECFRTRVKTAIVDFAKLQRDFKRSCRDTESDALPVELCVARGMAGAYARFSDSETPVSPDFQEGKCPFSTTDATIRCGSVFVPFDAAHPEGKKIKLAVAVLPKTGSGKNSTPLFFLEGGPGGESLSAAEIWEESVYRESRDIVLFDQRGTGFSEPKLDCAKYEGVYQKNLIAGENDDGFVKEEADALKECFRKYEKQGIDFSQFTSLAGTHDIEAIRLALGYDKISLLGISYGSRLALTAMREIPDSLESVVIESVLPPEENMFADLSDEIEAIFYAIIEKCDADENCAKTFPNFANDFDDLFIRLENDPADVSYIDEETGETIETTMGVSELAFAVYRLISTSEGIRYLPMLVDIAKRGELEPFVRILYAIEDEIALQIDPLVNFATLCNEEFENVDYSESSLLSGAEEEFITTYDLICSGWKHAKAPLTDSLPVKSSIPTIVFSGEFDPITPANWTEDIKKALPNSIRLVFPVGHGELTAFQGCGSEIASRFLQDPLKKPDIACMDELAEFRFITE